jgi:hypothetical protein
LIHDKFLEYLLFEKPLYGEDKNFSRTMIKMRLSKQNEGKQKTLNLKDNGDFYGNKA